MAGGEWYAGNYDAIIEWLRFGATCVDTGGMPTNTLARAAYVARRAAHFRVRLDGSISVDRKRVKAS